MPTPLSLRSAAARFRVLADECRTVVIPPREAFGPDVLAGGVFAESVEDALDLSRSEGQLAGEQLEALANRAENEARDLEQEDDDDGGLDDTVGVDGGGSNDTGPGGVP